VYYPLSLTSSGKPLYPSIFKWHLKWPKTKLCREKQKQKIFSKTIVQIKQTKQNIKNWGITLPSISPGFPNQPNSEDRHTLVSTHHSSSSPKISAA